MRLCVELPGSLPNGGSLLLPALGVVVPEVALGQRPHVGKREESQPLTLECHDTFGLNLHPICSFLIYFTSGSKVIVLVCLLQPKLVLQANAKDMAREEGSSLLSH